MMSTNPELSDREYTVMEWVAAGKTNGEIAAILGISASTVKNHMGRIFTKLGACNRVEAIVFMQRRKR